ncbi:MAG: hypothetical protein ACI9OJ_003858, partial [Myxococcota bacterium]
MTLLFGACDTSVDTGVTCQVDSDCAVPDGQLCNATASCVAGTCAVLFEPVDCTSELACQVSTCDPTTGACVAEATPDGAVCDDGDLCTIEDQCLAGGCAGRAKCADEDECQDATCDPGSGTCDSTPKPDFTDCDDADSCTSNDVCVAGTCAGQSTNCADDDGDPCTVTGCKGEQGCVTSNAVDGTECDDGDACTVGDSCSAGACSPGASPCDETANPCIDAVCNADTGECDTTSKADATACDDGDLCTQADECTAGMCGSSTPTCVPSDNECIKNTCDTTNGSCTPVPAFGNSCDDGLLCTSGDSCDIGGTCVGDVIQCPLATVPCDVNVCDPTSGNCVGVPEIPGKSCDDGNLCTVATTCGVGGCTGQPKCSDDGNSCTAETCDPTSGACETSPLEDGTECDDGNACTGVGSCATNACLAGQPIACDDDGDSCTIESCDVTLGCQHIPAPDGASCNDGFPCTSNEKCNEGACEGGLPTVCAADGDPCTDESCEPGVGCIGTQKADGTSCDDSDECTIDETCDGGLCSGAPLACTTENDCLFPQCDSGLGCLFVSQADGAACDDGNPCTQATQCDVGGCLGGIAVNCPAPEDPCLVSFCDVSTGQCTTGPAPDGGQCDDGNPCTLSDLCGGGECLSGEPFDCGEPEDDCQQRACNTVTGTCDLSSKANGTLCDEDNPCATAGICAEGSCTSVLEVECDDPDDPCLVGVCDKKTGECTTSPGNNGSACDPGDPCLVDGQCSQGSCGGGTSVGCPDDGDSCTVETCESGVGCVTNPQDDGTPCADLDPCTDATLCNAGSCSGGVQLTCPADGQPCTDDACVSGIGCIYPPSTDGSPCEDGNACSGPDACEGGQCAGLDSVVCDEANDVCQPNECDPTTGACIATAAAVGTACDDGNSCTTTDECSAGQCAGQVLPCESDANPCTVSQCDPAAGGCVTSPQASDFPCDDGDQCTSGDTCSGMGGCSGAVVVCDAHTENCKVNVCDPGSGGCVPATAANGDACDDGDACTT